MRILIHPAAAPPAQQPSDSTLAAFRAHMGAQAVGRSDADLAAWRAALDWIAEQAIAHAVHAARAGVASEAS